MTERPSENVHDQLRAARHARAPQRVQARPGRMLLLSHPRLSAARPLAAEMSEQLSAWQIAVDHIASADERAIDFGQYDLVVALGGDGWMLRAGRLTAAAGVPVLGVNLGRLGFLAEVQPNEWRSVFERVRDGD